MGEILEFIKMASEGKPYDPTTNTNGILELIKMASDGKPSGTMWPII